ncbi:hypothetical protein I3271_09395 [Photobacterium leiognathi]|nr:hypothetical protein [Photobacterium leiognathi]
MKPNDKTNAIERAKKGFDECKVIITSSVIEIGLTMPYLRTLLVIGAEKYGAGTLHQFRGRLARKGGHGTFIMMSSKNINETNEDTVHRLNILKNNTRGSTIAEEDMIQRGFGSQNNKSTAQSGNLDGVFRGVKVLPSDITELLNTTTGSQLLKPRRDAKQ